MKKKTLGIILCVLFILAGGLASLFVASKLLKTVLIFAGVLIGFGIYSALKKKDDKK